MNKKIWLNLLLCLAAGAIIGYSGGLLLSLFKTKDHVSTYNFQTRYVPEILALISLVPAYLTHFILRKRQNISENHQDILKTLARVISKRDDETEGHCERVAQYAMLLGQAYGIKGIQLQQLGWGAFLHDVGKISIPDHILLKPGKLTDEEWSVMRTHVHEGFRILMNHHFLSKGLDVVLFHHERWDGCGYPHQLKGDHIPVFARIFTIADSFDAMISNRPYRKGMSIPEAKAEIERCSGSQFCPGASELFLQLDESLLAQIAQGKALFPELQPLSRGRRKHAPKLHSYITGAPLSQP
jgi:HD-GYP domain-containing protein (c-di-GMP phosphodiesterase class II)